MKVFHKYCIISLILLASCAHRTDARYITTQNKSTSEIYCFYTDRELYKIDDVPRIGLATSENENNISLIGLLFWEDYIKSCDNQKIRYYIIKKDSVDKYGWKIIVKKNIFNKKYLFTVEDLDKINWALKYHGE